MLILTSLAVSLASSLLTTTDYTLYPTCPASHNHTRPGAPFQGLLPAGQDQGRREADMNMLPLPFTVLQFFFWSH